MVSTDPEANGLSQRSVVPARPLRVDESGVPQPSFEALQICLSLRPHLFSCAAWLPPSWTKQLPSHEQVERCIFPALLIHRSTGHFLPKGPGHSHGPRLSKPGTRGSDHRAISVGATVHALALIEYSSSFPSPEQAECSQRAGTIPGLNHTPVSLMR